MVRIIFLFIMLIHGLIHLMGFAKEWKIAEVKELTGKTLIPLGGILSKAAGILWLIASILFVASAGSFLLRKEWWWMIGLTAVIISQLLIILYWHDAKWGTIANILILFAVIVSYGKWNFNLMTSRELNTFINGEKDVPQVVTAEMISGLPPVVNKWLVHSCRV
jgi:hypothetical protein